MPDWSIKFVAAKNPTPNLRADFVLDVPGEPSSPFNVFQGDIVSWNNTTGDPHQPAVFNDEGVPQPIGGPLLPRTPSPGYAVAAKPGSRIRFCCTLHTGEVGELVVTTPGRRSGPPPSV